MSYRFADSLQASGVFHCTHSNGVCHAGLLRAVSKPEKHIPLLCVQWKTPDGGQRNCPKHVEFYSKNKCEKLVYLVGFIIRIYVVQICAIVGLILRRQSMGPVSFSKRWLKKKKKNSFYAAQNPKRLHSGGNLKSRMVVYCRLLVCFNKFLSIAVRYSWLL